MIVKIDFINRLVILLLSLTVSVSLVPDRYSIMYFLAALIVSYLPLVFRRSTEETEDIRTENLRQWLMLMADSLLAILSLWLPALAVYASVILYNRLAAARFRSAATIIVFPLSQIMKIETVSILLFPALCGIAIWLYFLTNYAGKNERALLTKTTDLEEAANSLTWINQQLLAQRDSEIQVAILQERNRIARDIHDSVGHVLSSAILQTAALEAVNQDERLNTALTNLQQTLQTGMNDTRKSLHALNERSFDLEKRLAMMLDKFSFCPTVLNFRVEEYPAYNISVSIIAIVKEALTNVAKHSNATEVRVSLREQPAFWQLSIKDNGNTNSNGTIASAGMGICGMAERVTALGGQFNILTNDGFSIIVTIPKPSVKE